jgi:hypothetical protein
MTQESQSISEYLPHIIVLAILLVLEYWIFIEHATSLTVAGDYGPMIAIPLILALVLICMIAFGLYSICKNTLIYKRIVSFSLMLFIVQIVCIFIEYVIFAVGL